MPTDDSKFYDHVELNMAPVDSIDEEAAGGRRGLSSKENGTDDASPASGDQGRFTSSVQQGKWRRLVPLARVVQDAYEYHGFNELVFFFLFALCCNLVLYFHWSDKTPTFKSVVQESFVKYGDPDFLEVKLSGADNMYDGIQYAVGWLEFHIQKSEGEKGYSGREVRVFDYAEILYARFLVNLENGCKLLPNSSATCYQHDIEHRDLNTSLGQKGWQNVGLLDYRQSTQTGTDWWSYTVIAEYLDCVRDSEGDPETICAKEGDRTEFLRRLAAVTTQTATKGWQEEVNYTKVEDIVAKYTGQSPPLEAEETEEWLLPFLGKYAYSFVVEIFARNPLVEYKDMDLNKSDTAIFTLQIQRAAVPDDAPNRNIWQITTTNPMRLNGFYTFQTDWLRLGFEVCLCILLIINTAIEIWQLRLCLAQHQRKRMFFLYWWNWIQGLSTLCVWTWVVFYIILIFQLKSKNWGVIPYGDNKESTKALAEMGTFSARYSNFLYGMIVLNALICFRTMRYMRIHTGLKAFYQVFIIAAREFIDFGVFLLYILLLLGCAVFAFFQLSGGNPQFLRFPDGLSLMTRLTFGFLEYPEFNNNSLGLGTAFAAVTALFWFGVLLLVVYSQNIILAIVAEAYEEAKATLGSADMSFLVLVLYRIAFALLLVLVFFKKLFCCACCSMGPDRDPAQGFTFLTLYRGIQLFRNPGGLRKHKQGSPRWKFASLAVVRTDGLKSLVNLYQDYATLKLNRKPIWLEERTKDSDAMAQFSDGTTQVAPLSVMGKGTSFKVVEDKGDPKFPSLGGGKDCWLAEGDLTRLFEAIVDLGKDKSIEPNPFRGLKKGHILSLVEAVMEVYGEQVDENAGGMVSSESNMDDQELFSGSMKQNEPRQSYGFFARMFSVKNALRAGGEGIADPTLKVIRNEQQRIERSLRDQAARQRSDMITLQNDMARQQLALDRLIHHLDTQQGETSAGVLHKTLSTKKLASKFLKRTPGQKLESVSSSSAGVEINEDLLQELCGKIAQQIMDQMRKQQ